MMHIKHALYETTFIQETKLLNEGAFRADS
jgi:hypothetical protein